jgi:Tol biopolymer transport system component
VSDYDLLEILDQGETAFLYKARDRRDGSLVAMEVFSPDVTPEEVREHRRGAAVGQASDGRFFVVRAFEGTDADTTVLEIPRSFAPARRPADLEPIARSVGREGGRVAHYRLLEQLGRGGMGVVYRAEDTRLRRTVALKFLPSGLTRDPASKARFLQEAQAASALDHTNICTIYEVGEAGDGELYLAMACYDGETIRAKINRGPLPVAEAVNLGRQVAQGLAKAHRHGLVHRDIKPANLMVTGDGVVKILDFGIAKLLGEAGATLAGAFAGTPAYMSPEQARGEEVDARTDVWSLGVVLHEMLTGARPLESPQRPNLPSGLELVLEKMLAPSPADRYPTAAEALADLTAFQDSLISARNTRRAVLWAVAAALAAGALAMGLWLNRRERPPVRGTFAHVTDQEGREEYPSLSPDGTAIVYVRTTSGQRDLYWQRVDGGEPKLLTPNSPFDDTQPAFSPDGQQIAFRSEREGGGIYLLALKEGTLRRIADVGYNPGWSPDAKALAVGTAIVDDPSRRTTDSNIWRLDVATGRMHQIALNDGVQPSWSPHGQRIAYWGLSADHDRRILWTVQAEGGKPVPVLDDGNLNWNPVWSPDGKFLYFGSDRNGALSLWRMPIDESSGKVLGQAELIPTSSEASGFWSFSRDGNRMSYASDDSRSRLERFSFNSEKIRVTGSGVPIANVSRGIRSCDISPDGQWIAYHAMLPQEDLYVVRSDGRDQHWVTHDRYKDRHPFWSPDGQWLLFYSNRRGIYEPWIIRPNGKGRRTIMRRPGQSVTYPIWSPDGKRIACTLGDEAVLIDLKEPPTKRSPKALPTNTSSGETIRPADWSSDGQSLAGNMVRLDGSVIDGIGLFYVQLGLYKRLTDSGSSPIWIGSGSNLLYLDKGAIATVDAETKLAQKVLSPAVNSEFVMMSLSPDQGSLFAVQGTNEGDVWLLTFSGKNN